MSQTPPNPVPPDSDPTGPSQRPGPGAGPSPGAGPGEGPGLDAAQQSLSDALRVSFTVLKALMIGLLVIYLFSGVFRVKEETTTVRYLFGEEIGTYSDARWYFGLPYPFEEKIVVPGKIQTLRLDDSFWYHNPDDKKPEDLAFEQLDPLKDSFLITGDTNVIHVQFGVNYSIDKDAVDDYLRNVGSLERANELVRTAAERGMIHYVATTNVEDTITKSKFDTPAIASYTQRVLDELQTGIQIQQVLIDNNNQSMPNQVREAYTGVTRAQADKAKTIQEARREYNQTLGKAAGGAHTELLSMIRAYEWALAGDADGFAELLRSVLDRSLAELRLPDAALMAKVRAYQAAAAEAAATDDAALKAAADSAAADLRAALPDPDAFEPTGAKIAGEIASAISEARARRFQIANKAEQDFNRYASNLATYRKTPRLLAATRLQETREKVMSDVLVQTIVGPITRIITNADPEVQEEIAEQELADRRERARQQQESQ